MEYNSTVKERWYQQNGKIKTSVNTLNKAMRKLLKMVRINFLKNSGN